METYREFAIASQKTNKVFPKTFKTELEAEKYMRENTNPENWKVVWREVTCSDWR